MVLFRKKEDTEGREPRFDRQLYVIKRISGQLGSIVDDIAGTSDHVKQAAGFMAVGASQEVQTVESCIRVTSRFMDTMENMNRKSTELTQSLTNASEINRLGNNTISALGRSEEKNEVAMRNLSENIRSLLDKVQEIDKIVNIIYKISEQTTLISYNAMIEAANAGKYGEGFSVVAGEIRRLSEESRSASVNINGTVQDIVGDLNEIKAAFSETANVLEGQHQSVESVTKVFEQINGITNHFIDEQKNFNRQFDDVEQQGAELIGSLRQIFSKIQESAASTEEVASLTMSQNSSTEILTNVSKNLLGQVGTIPVLLSQEEAEALNQSRRKVSFIYDLDVPFWDPAAKEARKAAEAFDVQLDVFAPKSRDGGAAEMERKLDQILAEGRDALIIAPIEDERIENELREISRTKTRIIFVNSRLDGVNCDSLIETNGLLAGKAAAEVAKKYLNNSGEAIVGLWTDEHITSIENRAKGFINELGANSNITVHQVSVKGNPSFEEAERTITEMLRKYPNTKLLFSTDVCWGLLYAEYARRHKTGVKVVTMDYTREIDMAIKDGLIDSAISQRAFSWGTTALNFLERIWQGETVPEYVDTGTYEVNQSNLRIYENRL